MKGVCWLGVLVQLAACNGGPPDAPSMDAGQEPDAGDPDAGSPPGDAPPQVAPCEVLGLPDPPSFSIAAGVVRLRDIDGDGKLDLVVVGAAAVSVFPGNGDTLFGASIDSVLDDPTISSVSSAQIADLDGDGKLDVVQASDSGPLSAVNILLGDGTGRFQIASSYPTPSVTAVAVADLDGDGKLDLALTTPDAAGGAGMMRVRLGRGDGTFGDEGAFAVGNDPSDVVVTDLDRDGKPDAIVLNHSDETVTVLAGHGDGTFEAKEDRDTHRLPIRIAASDLDGDGSMDLVILSQQSVSVLLNDGTGALGDGVDYAVRAVASVVGDLAVGDVDRDGMPDTVALNGATLNVLAGNGDGTLQPVVATKLPEGTSGLALGDLSGDDALDALLVNTLDHPAISVLTNDGAGRLGAATDSVGVQSTEVAAADLNGDGRVDLVLTGIASIDVALGTGDGAFRDAVSYPVVSPRGRAVVADVNGDGMPDLVVGAAASVNVLLGNGDGTFRAPVDSPLSARWHTFVVADLDGDGKPDLIAADPDLSVYGGNGDGTFQARVELAALPYIATVVALAVGDFDGDRRPDIVAGYRPICVESCPLFFEGNADLFLHASDGTFRTSFHISSWGGTFAIGDLDGDGKLDVVTPNNGVSVWGGNGDGTLRSPTLYGSGIAAILRLADITGDGKLDVVRYARSNVPGNTVMSLLPGNGDGSFGPVVTYPELIGAQASVADIDGDGRLDLVLPGNRFDVLHARCVR